MSISRRNLVRLLPAMVVLVAACAYFNTFHNAKKYYAEGVTMKEQGQQTQAKAKFDKAVEKSARVIQRWPRFSTAARPKPGPGVGPGLELVPAEAGSRPDARRRKAGVGLALTGEEGGRTMRGWTLSCAGAAGGRAG